MSEKKITLDGINGGLAIQTNISKPGHTAIEVMQSDTGIKRTTEQSISEPWDIFKWPNTWGRYVPKQGRKEVTEKNIQAVMAENVSKFDEDLKSSKNSSPINKK